MAPRFPSPRSNDGPFREPATVAEPDAPSPEPWPPSPSASQGGPIVATRPAPPVEPKRMTRSETVSPARETPFPWQSTASDARYSGASPRLWMVVSGVFVVLALVSPALAKIAVGVSLAITCVWWVVRAVRRSRG